MNTLILLSLGTLNQVAVTPDTASRVLTTQAARNAVAGAMHANYENNRLRRRETLLRRAEWARVKRMHVEFERDMRRPVPKTKPDSQPQELQRLPPSP